MCDFCTKHGTGKYWYQWASRYARQMYHRRRTDRKVSGAGGTAQLEAQMGLAAIEAIQAKNLNPEKFPELVAKVNQLARVTNSGQVITLEDAKTMIDLASPIAFIACDCRRQLHGYIERDLSKMTCLGLGVGMFRWEREPSRYVAGVHFVSDKEAKKWLETWDKKGMVHSLMTFGLRDGAPYIGGLCNCTYPDCISIRWRRDYGIEQLIKGERVAVITHPEKCNGCFQCVSRCQFGAITANIRSEKPYIDLTKCFGCGLCATGCKRQVIELVDRRNFEVLKHSW
ncbi:MAG: hypothetical protein QW261_09540 [Candidatus Jordarchaeaceae archaeon]